MVNLLLNIKTTYFRLFEWLRVALLYYPHNLKFIWVDCLLALQYLWKNPHQISKAYLKQKGAKNIYCFGETPLTTLDHIAKECRILSKDVVYELGCGSARTCFWLRSFIKCHVVGIDYLPQFIQKARRVKKWAFLNKLDLIQSDMLLINLRRATVIYLYGTCLEEETIKQLVDSFNQLRPKTKVITVSYPLTDYTDAFNVTKHFTGRFPWGKADIFINEKKTPSKDQCKEDTLPLYSHNQI